MQIVTTIKQLLQKRISFLQKTIESKEKEIQKLPAGKIRAMRHHKSFQYFIRESPQDKKGTYIPAKEIAKAAKMLQQEYDCKVLKAARKELSLLQRLDKFYESDNPEMIYEKMPIAKKRLMKPIVETEEDYLQRWLNKPFEKLGFAENAPEYYTRKGERVRSKSEVIIADILFRLGIEYVYEMPLQLNNGMTIRPDFTIIDASRRRLIFYEHLGMIDDSVYLQNALHKIHEYQESGCFLGENLLISAETIRSPLDTKMVEKQLKHYVLGK